MKSREERRQRIVDFYLLAKGIVLDEGFQEEISWQTTVRLTEIDETAFLKEAAWVVLSSGMREAIVRKKFPALSRAFYQWTSAHKINEKARECRQGALAIFSHAKKIDAIIEIARRVNHGGFDSFKRRVDTDGVAFLQTLPYIGPATSLHLAKNIGADVVKPDRHLLRISSLAGFDNPTDFCKTISSAVGDRLSVVDLVVWRYATLNPGYLDFLTTYLH